MAVLNSRQDDSDGTVQANRNGSGRYIHGEILTRAGLYSYRQCLLAGYLKSGEELDIQTTGYTKCRFPVLAKRYVVREGDVLHANLSNLKPIGE